MIKIALGGLKGENFSEDALGLFYRELYGLNFDLGEVIARLRIIEREGDKIPEEALKVTVKVEKPDFIKLVEIVGNSIANAIDNARRVLEIPETEIGEVGLEDPFIGLREAGEFLKNTLKLSPASCRESFIILALNGISRRYMEIACKGFPEIGELESLKRLFELSPILKPELVTESLSEEYTIWGFHEGTTGCFILEAIETLWEITALPPIQKYFGVESELKRYVERAYPSYQRALPKGKPAYETMEKLRNIGSTLSSSSEAGGRIAYKISTEINKLTNSYNYWGRWRLEGSKVIVSYLGRSDHIVFPFFIDYLSPALFLKLGGFGSEGKSSLKTIGAVLSEVQRRDIYWWAPIL